MRHPSPPDAEYLCGAAGPTIADLLAYEEVVQLTPRYGNLLDCSPYPRVIAWLEKMSRLPYHHEVSGWCP